MDFIQEAVSPARINISFLGMEVGQSVVVGWIIVAVVLVLALVLRLVFIPRFRDVPKKLQSILELIIDWVQTDAKKSLHAGGTWFGPYIFAVAVYIGMSGVIEMFGFPCPAADLSMTAALGLLSFFFINAYAFRYLGFIGRFKALGMIFPIKILTDIATPISLSCRLYGNMMGGMIIMDLLYAVTYVAVPAVLSIYFNLFHTAMQTYIFITLTMAFMNEPLERLPKQAA